ncbi:MAG: ABC transporter substrate-binding protein [Methylobacteriaceae bacterium]|nr:ABC transporter substrate-binding protein [Methylobacteriaceae bacterium]
MSRLSLIAALAASVALTAPVLAQEPLRIGVVTHLTGAAAGPFGIPARNGAELLIDAINSGTLPAPYATKGMAGQQLEMTLVDEAGAPARIATEVRSLIDRKQPHAVVGFVTTGTCLAALPVLEETKTLSVLSTCGTPRVFEDAKYEYLFRTSANATADGVTAARYLLARMPELKSYAGINQNFAFGQDSWRDFTLAMQALKPGFKATMEQFPTLGSGQYGAEITSLLSNGPQATFSSFFGSDLEAFVLQMAPRQLNAKTQLVLSTGETAMYRLGAKLPDGVIIAGRGPYGVFARPTDLNKWFRKAYEDRYNVPPTYPAYHAAQALLGLKVAYDKAAAAKGGGVPSRDEVARAFRGIEYEAFGTTIRMAQSDGRQAVTESAIGVYKFDRSAGTATVTDVTYYPADCVNPPEGAKSIEWLQAGMPGAKCNLSN